METQHEQLSQDERQEYVAPAGEELGMVKELTKAICFPSCQGDGDGGGGGGGGGGLPGGGVL
jgi:hypothetical protein